MERVDGYMKRAEDLKNVLESQHAPPPSKGGGGGGEHCGGGRRFHVLHAEGGRGGLTGLRTLSEYGWRHHCRGGRGH